MLETLERISIPIIINQCEIVEVESSILERADEPLLVSPPDSEMVSKSSVLRNHADAVIAEMRHFASWILRGETSQHSLQTSDLVQEAWLRLAELTEIRWNDSQHIARVGSLMMHRILVDHARKKKAQKRSGHLKTKLPEEGLAGDPGRVSILLDLDEAIARLRQNDEVAAEIAQHRIFAERTLVEIVEVVGLSLSTIKRKWRLAQSWLSRELADV